MNARIWRWTAIASAMVTTVGCAQILGLDDAVVEDPRTIDADADGPRTDGTAGDDGAGDSDADVEPADGDSDLGVAE